MTRNNDSLRLENEKLKLNLNEINEQLKSKVERIRSLDTRVIRMEKEKKQNVENIERLQNSEIEIANLKKNVESLNGRLKVRENTIVQMKIDMEKIYNELKMQTSSIDALEAERNHLQTVLDELKKEERIDPSASLLAEIVSLNEQIEKKSGEIFTLNDKIVKLMEENVS